MTSADRTKLARILGMLGSAHDGERAAAGLLATKLLRTSGTTWEALLGSPNQPDFARTPTPTGPRADAMAVCARYRQFATEWEARFLAGIAQRTTLTGRQLAALLRIAAELPGRAAG